jgi:hypothetical protein
MPQAIENTIREQTNLLAAELQRIAVVLDQLWQDSLAAGSRHAIALDEASQGLHRALLALTLQRLSAETVVDVREWA